MKIAFVYSRLNMSKWYAPIIQLATQSGIDVECFIDHRDVSGSTKWYEFPDLNRLKEFLPREVSFLTFKSLSELEGLIDKSSANFLFSLGPIPFGKKNGMKWIHIIPSLHDSFIAFSPEQLAKFDIIFCNSDFWAQNCITYMNLSRGLEPESTLANEIKEKLIPVGSPQYDHFPLCDKYEFKKRMGWPENKKVVTVYAFETSVSFWAQRIFHTTSRWKRLIFLLLGPFAYPRIFSKLGLRKFFEIFVIWLKRFSIHFSQTLFCPSEEEILRAIKDFCVKNDLYFVIKSRKKNPLKAIHKEIGDFVIEEDTDYFPYTSAQVINASDLLISFYSTSAIECAVSGVPYINLSPIQDDLYLGNHYTLQFEHRSNEIENAERTTLYRTGPNTLFNFEGVIWNYEIREFELKFRNLSMQTFSVNNYARAEYIRKFVDPSPQESPAARILNTLVRSNH